MPDPLEMSDFRSILMERGRTGHLRIDAQLDGHAGQLIVDTGASRTVLDRTKTLELGFLINELETLAGGLGTTTHALSICTLQHVVLGNDVAGDAEHSLVLGTRDIHVLDLTHVNAALEKAGDPAVFGVLGADIMFEHRAVIDYGKALLYLHTI